MSETQCRVCGTKTGDLRGNICFDCASNAERRAASRTVEEHLENAIAQLKGGDITLGRIYCQWAYERLTDTGDYAPGGTFDAEYPGWRNDRPQP